MLYYKHTTPHPFKIYGVCVCVHAHAHTCIHVCHSVHEELRGKSVGIYSLLYVDFKDGIQAIRLRGKYHYLLNRLTALSFIAWLRT